MLTAQTAHAGVHRQETSHPCTPLGLATERAQAHLSGSEVPTAITTLPVWSQTHRDGVWAGIKAVLDKHQQGAKMTVHFRADLSGLLHPESADAAVEALEEYEVKVPVAGQPGAGKGAASPAGGPAAAETAQAVHSPPCATCTVVKLAVLGSMGPWDRGWSCWVLGHVCMSGHVRAGMPRLAATVLRKERMGVRLSAISRTGRP